ncbi:hypothetical protein Dsin_020646 [Dipteronia sinensis]|uniref:CCT domain-containing protein n=1 Tax=Dipteronia sinensis TaxID=43782 RepID=A0AAE0A9V1_9ROSI|nr:hypothetical protein Dsin_020646 [Dipteronia sinensis]
MGYHSFLISPKQEEQQVPDTINDTEFVDFKDFKESSTTTTTYDDAHKEIDINIMDELEGIWGIDDESEENLSRSESKVVLQGSHHQLNWDFMEWEGFLEEDEQEEEEEEEEEERNNNIFGEESDFIVKKEPIGFWVDDDYNDDDEKKKKKKMKCLKLNLNYQEVLDAWSDRGPLWADDCSRSMANNGSYMGEVPVMAEEERTRREASVLRYKEKRQTRLFSKKIRYQVRKLNADKRPRLKVCPSLQNPLLI